MHQSNNQKYYHKYKSKFLETSKYFFGYWCKLVDLFLPGPQLGSAYTRVYTVVIIVKPLLPWLIIPSLNLYFTFILWNTMHNSGTEIIDNAKSKFYLCERKIKTYLKWYTIIYFIIFNACEQINDWFFNTEYFKTMYSTLCFIQEKYIFFRSQ